MAKRQRQEKLADSFNYPPRLFRLDRAAAYLSMSSAGFWRLVEARILPKPIRIKGMVLWDRLALDTFVDCYGDDDETRNTADIALGISREQ